MYMTQLERLNELEGQVGELARAVERLTLVADRLTKGRGGPEGAPTVGDFHRSMVTSWAEVEEESVAELKKIVGPVKESVPLSEMARAGKMVVRESPVGRHPFEPLGKL